MNNLIADCHRHLGGSISPEFVWEIVQEQNMKWVGESFEEINQAMRCMPHEPKEFHRFLRKFDILNNIIWTEDLIDRSIKQVSEDLIKEDVDRCWMHFTINKYMSHLKWQRKDAIKFISERFDEHSGGRVSLILCLKYESTRSSQIQVAKLLEHPEVYETTHGIDLVGDEGFYEASFYGPVLKPWRDAKKAIFAHVGESRSAKNIGTAIEHLGVREVCHGVKLYQQPGLVSLARDNDVCFHMALSSNDLTGVTTPDHHPIIAFLNDNIPVTIGTDDPIQCNTTMKKEFDILEGKLLLSEVDTDTIEKYKSRVIATAEDRFNRYC